MAKRTSNPKAPLIRGGLIHDENWLPEDFEAEPSRDEPDCDPLYGERMDSADMGEC